MFCSAGVEHRALRVPGKQSTTGLRSQLFYLFIYLFIDTGFYQNFQVALTCDPPASDFEQLKSQACTTRPDFKNPI